MIAEQHETTVTATEKHIDPGMPTTMKDDDDTPPTRTSDIDLIQNADSHNEMKTTKYGNSTMKRKGT